MDLCIHDKPVDKFCIHPKCNKQSVAGCQICMHQNHKHGPQLKFISTGQLESLMKKFAFNKRIKPDCNELQESFFHYFKSFKDSLKLILASFDQICRNVVNRIGFPFLFEKGLFGIYKRIKSKDFKKISPQYFKNFVQISQSIPVEELRQKQSELYLEQIYKSHVIIKQMQSLVEKFSQITKQVKMNLNPVQSHEILDKINGKIQNLKNSPTKKEPMSNTKPRTKNASQIQFKSNDDYKMDEVDKQKRQSFNLRDTSKSQKSNVLYRPEGKTPQKKQNPRRRRKQSVNDLVSTPKNQKNTSILSVNKTHPKQSPVVKKNMEENRKKRRSSIDHHLAKQNNLDKIAKKLEENRKKEEAKAEKAQKIEKTEKSMDSDESSKSVELKNHVLPTVQEMGSEPNYEKLEVLPIMRKLQKETIKEAELTSPLLKRKAKNKKNHNQSQKGDDKQKFLSFSFNLQKSVKNDVSDLNQAQQKSVFLLISSISQGAEKAIPHLEKSLQTCASNLSSGLYLSYLYLQIGEFKRCLDLCQYFLKKINKSPSLKEQITLLTINKASALNQLGRYSQAIVTLQSFGVMNGLVYKNLGNAYYCLGKFEQAINLYKLVIEQNEHDEQAWYNLTVCLYSVHNFKTAKLTIQSALKQHPNKEEFLELQRQIKFKLVDL